MAQFELTQRAFSDLIAIEEYSIYKWGVEQTEKYMSDLYDSFKKIAQKPEIGQLRMHRSFPFSMAPTGKHFVVYTSVTDGIIILTILHGRQDIESIIDSMWYKLSQEIRDIMR